MENSQSIVVVAGTVTAICTAIYHIYKVRKVLRADREEFRESILAEAEERDTTLRLELNNKIRGLHTELDNLKFNVNKDMKFLKENYASEIKNLGEKIEVLREEIRGQHSNLLNLITKLVERS